MNQFKQSLGAILIACASFLTISVGIVFSVNSITAAGCLIGLIGIIYWILHTKN